MEPKNEAPAGAEAGGRECGIARAGGQAQEVLSVGCRIFKLPLSERRALLDEARANLAAASVWLDIDPPPGRCAACGLRLDGEAPAATVRAGGTAHVKIHLDCRRAMAGGEYV